VEVGWKNLQEVTKGNKGQLYATSYFSPEMSGLAKALLPSVFPREIQCNEGFPCKEKIMATQKIRFNSR